MYSLPAITTTRQATQNIVDRINSFQTPTNSTYIQKINSKWRIWSPINEKWAQYYETEKELSPDDNDWESVTPCGLMRYFEVRLPDSKTGAFGNDGLASGFANVNNATVTIVFTGTGLFWASRKDTTGQPWNYVITNTDTLQTYTGSFSTNNPISVFGLTLIREDLPYGNYTCTCTVGAFGGFPWCGLAADGSFFDSAIFIKCFWIVGSPTPNCCNEGYGSDAFNPKIEIRGGHQAYAFSIKGLLDSGQNNWIPNHSTVEYATIFANLATDRVLQFNGAGANLITSLTTNVTYGTSSGSSIVLYKKYKGLNKDFPSNILFDIESTWAYDKHGVTYTITATTLTALDASVMYMTMHDQSAYVDNGYLNTILIGGQEIDLAPNPGIVEVISHSALPNWNGQVLGVATSGTDFVKSLASGTSLITSVSSGFNLANNFGQRIILNSNNLGTKKIYPELSDNYQIPSGTTFSWQTKVTIGLVSDAYNTLKQTVNP